MIELEHVTKRYGTACAVADVSLTIGAGEFCAVIGGSGAGKSTMLKMINQLIAHSEGTIRVGGQDVRALAPAALRRRMGFVIQSIGLFPHWTVARNIGTVPELLGWATSRTRDRAAALLEHLKLPPGEFLDKYPHQLSIGQQQRVGIARALAADQDILLMDEPFGALDPITRQALQAEIADIQRASRKTIVFVTHDMDEALRLASRIAVMDRGQLVQLGTPIELLTAPKTDFVRNLVGRDDLGIKLLGIAEVASRMRPGEAAPGEPIAATASLRQALSRMVAEGRDRLPVAGPDGGPAGALHLADLLRR
ncbi:MAG TPA: ABC transporter ATP-binding protein [Stellaceae bacterium]|nr:ABC transporter ATP-binding protein [Stellaceae bacterium]